VDNGCECKVGSCTAGAGEHVVAFSNSPQPRIVRWKVGSLPGVAPTVELFDPELIDVQLFPDQGRVGLMGVKVLGLGTQRPIADLPKVPLSGRPFVVAPGNGSPLSVPPFQVFSLFGNPFASFPIGTNSDDPVQQGEVMPGQSSAFPPARVVRVNDMRQLALWVNDAAELRMRVSSDAAGTSWEPVTTVEGLPFSLTPSSPVVVSAEGNELGLMTSEGQFCAALVPTAQDHLLSFTCYGGVFPMDEVGLPFSFGFDSVATKRIVAWSALGSSEELELRVRDEDGIPLGVANNPGGTPQFGSPTLLVSQAGLQLVMQSKIGLAISSVDGMGGQISTPYDFYTTEPNNPTEPIFGNFSALIVNY
jgi:hypothetical protein